MSDDYFPDCPQIADFYHGAEYLAYCAEALFPTDAQAAHAWLQARRADLYLGQIHRIIAPLEQAGLTTQAEYFRKHTRRMQYQEFREQDYPTPAPPAEQVRVGSGTIKSGIKRFKYRLSGPGMRWSRLAADRMLVLRAAVLSGTFDELWTLAPN